MQPNHELVAKIIQKYRHDDVLQLVSDYVEACNQARNLQLNWEEQVRVTKILEAENQLLKKEMLKVSPSVLL